MERPDDQPDRMLRLCLWAAGYATRHWAGLAAVLATMLLRIGLDLLTPWPTKILIDNVLAGAPLGPRLARLADLLPGAPTPVNLATWCVAATVVLFLLAWTVGVLAGFANISFGQRMVFDLAGDLFAHIQRLSLRFHARRGVGDLMRRITSDCGSIATITKDAMLPVLTSAATLVAMFFVMWRMHPGLTALSLAVVPLMILSFRRYSAPMMERSYAQEQAEGRIYEIVEQTLSAIPVVQAFGREELEDRRFREGTAAALRANVDSTTVQMKFRILMGFATAAGTAAILWLGAHQVLAGRLTVGNILVFLAYLGALYAPLEALMYTPSTVQAAAGGARRVREILRTEHEVADRPDAPPLPTPVRGHLRLEGVTFGYDPDRPVLRNVSLEVLPGQTVAVVGPTGAGKSTLVSLVPRFYDPWSGRVTIDGQDVRDLRLRSLREHVALVLQDPFLFPLSVAENIAYGRPDATREEVEAAARAANADEFVRHLPEGYATVIGERGATLSGGQRQRLSIARALLKDAPVLILDEPTSALDAGTEQLLLEALDRLAAGRTTLVIAHRLSTIRAADRIVVLDEGAVVEQGTHAELMARGGLYARFYRIQFGLDAEAAAAAAATENGPATDLVAEGRA